MDIPKNDDDFYGLRYAEFTVPLVKAVQELDAKIEQQQAVQELNEKNEALQTLIEQLEAKVKELQSN